jgi:D-arabinitol dehydrogenase (NADP+)
VAGSCLAATVCGSGGDAGSREGGAVRAVVIAAPGRVAVEEVAVPSPGPGDVLIRVRAAGICGTDLHILDGEYEAHYPIVPGHEFSGEVAALGAGVEGLSVGDRVTADPNIPCERCIPCRRNEQNQCARHAAVGVTRDGAFAEYVSVPERVVFPIGDLSFAAAALVEPLACVVWGLRRVRIRPGDAVLVHGAGPMGCLLLQAVARSGAALVVVSDPVAGRLDLARSLGAHATVRPEELEEGRARALAPDGFDVVIDATGLPAVVEASFRQVRARGTIWLFGVCPPDATVRVSPYTVFRKDLTIVGSFALSKTFPESIALIRGGAVRVEPLISHRLPLERAPEALRIARDDPDRMKVQLQP